MTSTVIIPDFGTSVDNVTLIKWLIREGQDVHKGDPLCEIETDKATTELESFYEGKLLQILVPDNSEVSIGSAIAYIGNEGEAVPSSDQPADETAPQTAPSDNTAADTPAQKVIIPDFGTSVDTVKFINWLKEQNEYVEKGDPLCEIETDKATTELESFVEGYLLKTLARQGQDIAIGSVIAYIGPQGAAVPETTDKQSVSRQTPSPPTDKPAPPAPAAPSSPGTIKATPKARACAKEHNIDLTRVTPTGKDNCIIAADVLAFTDAAPAAPAGPQTISRKQRGVIKAITISHRETIPIHLTGKIRMQPVINRRRKILEETSVKVAFDSFFVHAVGRLLPRYESFRSRIVNDERHVVNDANIGLAVSVDDDLYIPVLSRCDNLNLEQTDSKLQVLVAKTRNNTLTPTEMQDGVFTISNLGMYAVESFTAIIPPGQSGILTLGRTEPMPNFTAPDTFTFEPCLKVILAVDHRLINGSQAARFLTELKDLLESY